jgi:hypothetical protein
MKFPTHQSTENPLYILSVSIAQMCESNLQAEPVIKYFQNSTNNVTPRPLVAG